MRCSGTWVYLVLEGSGLVEILGSGALLALNYTTGPWVWWDIDATCVSVKDRG